MADISAANWNRSEFAESIHHVMQQKTSRLRSFIDWKPCKGKKEFINYLGVTETEEKVGLAPDTPNMGMNHIRRKLTWKARHWGTLLDDDQLVEIGSDPKNEYVMAAKKRFERDIDDFIIEKMLATSYVGEEGETTADLPAEALLQTASTALGMTAELVRKITEYFEINDKDPDDIVYLAISPKGKTQLLNTTKYGSKDFNREHALAAGKLPDFAGVRFVETNRLVLNGDGRRRLIAWLPGAFQGRLDEAATKPRLTERDDKSYAAQAYCKIRIGGARMQESMVAEIPINEAA